jgi:hypothetical protein
LRHPDARVEILASAGRDLSSEMQDGQSFRYGVVNLGARDRQELFEKFEEFRRDLGFVLLTVSSAHVELPLPVGRSAQNRQLHELVSA